MSFIGSNPKHSIWTTSLLATKNLLKVVWFLLSFCAVTLVHQIYPSVTSNCWSISTNIVHLHIYIKTQFESPNIYIKLLLKKGTNTFCTYCYWLRKKCFKTLSSNNATNLKSIPFSNWTKTLYNFGKLDPFWANHEIVHIYEMILYSTKSKLLPHVLLHLFKIK